MKRRSFVARTMAAGALWLAAKHHGIDGHCAAANSAHPSTSETLEEQLAGPRQGPWRRLFLDGSVIEARKDWNDDFIRQRSTPKIPCFAPTKPGKELPPSSAPIATEPPFARTVPFDFGIRSSTKGIMSGMPNRKTASTGENRISPSSPIKVPRPISWSPLLMLQKPEVAIATIQAWWLDQGKRPVQTIRTLWV